MFTEILRGQLLKIETKDIDSILQENIEYRYQKHHNHVQGLLSVSLFPTPRGCFLSQVLKQW